MGIYQLLSYYWLPATQASISIKWNSLLLTAKIYISIVVTYYRIMTSVLLPILLMGDYFSLEITRLGDCNGYSDDAE